MSLRHDPRLIPLALVILTCGLDPVPAPPPVPPSAAELAPTVTTERPHILIITLDTTRADALEPYGGLEKGSPPASRLAREGVVFERAYTVTPLTIPAHSSLFTGQYPPTHGVRDNGDFFLAEDVTTLAEHLRASGYQTMASVGAEVTSHHWGFAQGFDAYFDDMGEASARNRWRVERPGEAVVDDALTWLTTRGVEDEPWLAWVHLFDAHHPYTAPEAIADRFPGRPYQAEVASADAQIGRLIEQLEQSGELDRTWIFLMADHGEGHGSHGEALHGVLLYDATTRIPLIIRPPSLEASARLSFPVSLVDIAPTVLSIAGREVPAEMQGVDLRPWLENPARSDPAPRRIYIESLFAWHHYGWAPQRALVDSRYKLIDSTSPELYSKGDIQEQHNRAGTEPQTVTRMRGEVDDLTTAMESRRGDVQEARLSAEQMMQLEALGYMGTTQETDGPIPFRGELADPVTQLPILADVERARRALQEGDLDRASAGVEAVLLQEPGLVSVKALQVQIHIRQGDLERALELANELHEARPSSQSQASLGYLFLIQGQLDEAARFFAQALEIDPYLESCWRGYLHVLFIQGDVPALEAQLLRSQSFLPDSPLVIGMSGVMSAMKGELDAAEAQLLAALQAQPRQPFLNHGLGIIRRQQSRKEEAEAFFLQEIQVQPPAIPSRRLLVEIYASQSRFTDQLEQLKIIEAVEPPSALTAHSLAQVLFNLERFEDAMEPLMHCRSLAPAYPACAMLEANLLGKLGREDEAQAAYQRALELQDAVMPASATP